jgi:parallel beta-helix repeat protein
LPSIPILQSDINGTIATPLSFGAVGDARYCDASTEILSDVVTDVSNELTGNDVGKVFGVVGAGEGTAPLVGTIDEVLSTDSFRSSVAAGTTAIGSRMLYGTDDTAALQEAIDTLPVVYLPSDYCFLTGPLYCERQGASIWSMGHRVTDWNGLTFEGGNLILKPGGNTNPLLWMQECYHSRIFGVALNGSRQYQSSSGGTATLLVRNSAYSHFVSCRIVNGTDDGVRLENWSNLENGFSGMADEVNFTDCWILAHNLWGVVEAAGGTSIQPPGDETWTNCHINFNGSGGYYKPYGSFTKLTGCEVLTNNGHGILLSGSVGCRIIGCSVRFNGQHGIYLYSGQGHTISGNLCHINSRLYSSPRYSNLVASYSHRLLIDGNNCTDVAFASSASYGILLEGINNCRMVGNNCYPDDLVDGALSIAGGSDIEASCNIGFAGGILA